MDYLKNAKVKIAPEIIINECLDTFDELRAVNPKKAKRNNAKYDCYNKAIQIASSLAKKGKITASGDSPDAKYSHHSLVINIIDDQWDDTREISEFSELLTLFDGIMFCGDIEGNTSISCLIEDIYYEGE